MDDEYLVTAFVPSETACFANSPGRMSRTLHDSKNLAHPSSSKHDLRGLNLTGGDGGFLVVGGQFRCLGGDALKNIWGQNQIRVGVIALNALPLTNEFKMDMARFEIPVSG